MYFLFNWWQGLQSGSLSLLQKGSERLTIFLGKYQRLKYQKLKHSGPLTTSDWWDTGGRSLPFSWAVYDSCLIRKISADMGTNKGGLCVQIMVNGRKGSSWKDWLEKEVPRISWMSLKVPETTSTNRVVFCGFNCCESHLHPFLWNTFCNTPLLSSLIS